MSVPSAPAGAWSARVPDSVPDGSSQRAQGWGPGRLSCWASRSLDRGLQGCQPRALTPRLRPACLHLLSLPSSAAGGTDTASAAPHPCSPAPGSPGPPALLSALLAVSGPRVTPARPCSLYSVGVLIKLCFGGKKQTEPQFTVAKGTRQKLGPHLSEDLPFRQGGLHHRQGAGVCRGRFWG